MPAGPLLTAIESHRTLPTRRTIFDSAKIVHVMDGAARVDTALGVRDLSPGDVLMLGARTWCSLVPMPAVRVWTLYADVGFLRSQVAWALPVRSRAVPGAHPLDWTDAPLILRLGLDRLRRLDPIWRQLSVLNPSSLLPEQVAARTVALFSWALELSVETLVLPDSGPERTPQQFPVLGSFTSPSSMTQAARAAELLRARMSEAWTIERLSGEVALSRAHLTRLFCTQFGVAPIQFLTEARLTEFTRLIEESNLTINAAARSVGWQDSRVAAAWFRRRFGVTPTEFRRSPHPFATEDITPAQ